MKSKLIALIVALMLPMTAAMAQDNMKDLKLKLADLQDQLDELDERLEVTEQHTVLDKINFSFELRSRVDSLNFEDMRGLPGWASTMMGLWSFNRLAVPAGEIGGVPMGSGSGYTFNPAFVMANQELLMGMMPAMMQMGFIDGNGFVDMNGNSSFDMYDMPMIGVNSLGAPFFSNRFGAPDDIVVPHEARAELFMSLVSPKAFISLVAAADHTWDEVASLTAQPTTVLQLGLRVGGR